MVTLCACNTATPNNPTNSPMPNESTAPVKKEYNIPSFKSEAVNNWKGLSYTYNESLEKVLVNDDDTLSSIATTSGIKLSQGTTIDISFSAYSSDITELIFNINGPTINYQKVLTIDENKTTYQFDFEYNEATDYDAIISFSINKGKVILGDLEVSSNNKSYGIRANQEGYLKEDFKTATLAQYGGDIYYLKDANTDEIKYRGRFLNPKEDKKSGEYNYFLDFSDFKEEGEYYLETEFGSQSYPFKINDDVYKNAYDKAIRFLTSQRCGTNLSEEQFGAFAHTKCHEVDSKLYTTLSDTYIDTRGGWHDAGDYGRYVQTGVKALTGVLLAQLINPSSADDLNIPESSNGIPDILDEARQEIEWLSKMQKSNGYVYRKVTTKDFPSLIMPEDDDATLYLLSESTLTTSSFVGAISLASIVYEQYDKDYASLLKERALKGYEAIKANSLKAIESNPDGFTSGDYLDKNEADERFFAYAGIYALTKVDEALKLAKNLYYKEDLKGSDAASVKDYGLYLLLANVKHDSFYEDMLKEVTDKAYSSIYYLRDNNYPYPYTSYTWGSNMHVAEDMFNLEMAYLFTGNKAFLNYASYELNYLLGQNCLGICFETGVGFYSPNIYHHRIAYLKDGVTDGALVGGVDQNLSDGINDDRINDETPIAKRYSMTFASYSTNEVAIHYNGAYILALSFLQGLTNR